MAHGIGIVEGMTGARPILRVHSFGKLAVHFGGREIAVRNRKCRALLAYLALSDSGTETRERLVGLFWSETDEERARASLRQTLYELRDALAAAGFSGLGGDKLSVRLDRSQVEIDVDAVLADAKAGRPHPLLLDHDRLFDSLLEELESIDPAFRVWLLAKRQLFHDRTVALLEDALRRATGASGAVENIARALARLDPTHEEAARALIRARAAAGDLGGALGIYKALWNLLDEEYDVEPSPATQQLIGELKLGQPPFPAGRTEPRTPADIVEEVRSRAPIIVPGATLPGLRPNAAPKLVLAIAPFDLEGTAPAHRHIVQGFRRELIACLVRLGNGWCAISRSAQAARREGMMPRLPSTWSRRPPSTAQVRCASY